MSDVKDVRPVGMASGQILAIDPLEEIAQLRAELAEAKARLEELKSGRDRAIAHEWQESLQRQLKEQTEKHLATIVARDRALDHAEALAKALTEALRRLTTAHARLKDPKMGGEHVGNALAELEKQRAPLHAPLGAYRAEHPEKP